FFLRSHLYFFLFLPTSTILFYTLSLHDALPISDFFAIDGHRHGIYKSPNLFVPNGIWIGQIILGHHRRQLDILKRQVEGHFFLRSEEHTSELQSRFDLVCRLLLEKKNKRSDY